LWSALSWFCRRFGDESESGLKSVFLKTGIFPKGGGWEKPLTYDMLVLMRQVKADALYYLDRLGKLPEPREDAPLSPVKRLDPNRLKPQLKYDLTAWKELRERYPELNEEGLLRSYRHMLRERILTQKIYQHYLRDEFAFAVTDAGHEVHGAAAAQAFHHEVNSKAFAAFAINSRGPSETLVIDPRHAPSRFAISPHYRSGTLVGMWADLQGYRDFFADYIRQQLSRATDRWSKGRQTASHFNDQSYQTLPGQSEVGRNLLKAVGYARALQQSGHRDAVVYAEIGDGSMALSDLHEAMTGAAVMGYNTRSLPVVMGIVDNQMAISVEPSSGRALVDIQAYSKAFGAEFYTCDGNDYLDVYRTYREATRKARTEQKPVIVWVQNLSRLNNHSSAAQFQFDFNQHDPLLDMGEALVQAGLLQEEHILRRHPSLNQGGFFGNHDLGEIGNEEKRMIDDTWERVAEEAEPTLKQMREEDIRLRFPTVEEPPPTGRLTQIIINGAIRAALRDIITENPLTWVNGQDTGMKGGVMQATAGLWELFPRQVTDAPINEPAIVGSAVGFALHEGAIAFPEIQFGDYALSAYHWLVYAGNLLWTSGGTRKINFNLRLPVEPGIYGAVYHSTPLEGYMSAIPIPIVCFSTTWDTYGGLRSIAEYAGPVLIFEPKALYRKAVGPAFPNEPEDPAEAKRLASRISIHRGIPDIPKDIRVPLGKAAIRKTGNDLTIVTWGLAHYKTLEILGEFQKHGIDVEVIDLRTLVPPDMDTVLKSVRKTGRLLVVHQDRVFASLGREIQGQVHEAFAGQPVATRVLGMEPVPGVPQNKAMEDAVIVGGKKILSAALQMMGRTKKD
jgi:2-oxoisovalerate dehydrogenase E1 component